MKILIDGYNLIFAWGWMPRSESPQAAEAARIKLFQKLRRLIPAPLRGQVTIVFDVKRPAAVDTGRLPDSVLDPSGFQVRFANNFPDADTLIEELIRKEIAPKRLVVVSTDQRLRTAAQRRRALSIRSEEFLDRVEELVEHGLPVSPGEPRMTHSGSPDATARDSEQGRLMDSKPEHSELSEIDWLAEFGIEPAELDPQKPSESDASSDQASNLDEWIDVRLKKRD